VPGTSCPLCHTPHAPGATCAGKRGALRREKPPAATSGEGPEGLGLEEPAADPVAVAAGGATIDAESLILEMVSMPGAAQQALGPYRLLEPLGEGGMGKVYRARDTVLDRDVAVKVISRDLLHGNAEAVTRFLAEAKLTARIRHPNVVQIHTLGTDSSGNPFLVMELLEGKTLKQALQAREPFPLPRIVHITSQILAALGASHEHLVHRDIKPANIFLVEERGVRDTVKVLDFGVAKAASEAALDLTGEGRFVGTPAFIAPEVVTGRGDSKDPRQDLYAVGVLLFLMLTGKSPWPSGDSQVIFGALHAGKRPRSIRDVHPSIDPALADLVDRAMALSPDDRFQSAAEFLAALRALGDFAPGSVVAETYRIVRKIAEGGMSAVYLADDLRMDRRCVLKVLLHTDADDPTGAVRERFRQDGALAKETRHPHVVEVFAQGVWNDRPYLVTEYVEGETLRARLPALGWDELLSLTAQVAAALDAIHEKAIIHRDVTPENILVAPGGIAKLVDFGIARREGSELTGSNLGFVLGRYGYAAPEQALDARAVDAHTDEWSLAAIVYEALTGRAPHREPDEEQARDGAADDLEIAERYAQRLLGEVGPRDPREFNPTVTPDVAGVLARALAREPHARFPSASAFASALAAARAEGMRLHAALTREAEPSAPDIERLPPKTPAPVSTNLMRGARSSTTRLRRRAAWLTAALGTAVVAGVAVVVLLRSPQSPTPVSSIVPAPSLPGLPAATDAKGLESAAPHVVSSQQPTTARPPVAENGASARLRLDSNPPGGVLVLENERVPLPAFLERPPGTRLAGVVEKTGFQPAAVELLFESADGELVVSLHARDARRRPPRRGSRPRADKDQIEWREIYVRPEPMDK
jgi:serine/threonine protein kinase